jgi:hypothetical protein
VLSGHGAYALGERAVGDAVARFVFVPRPRRWLAEGWLDRAVDEHPDRVLVVIGLDVRGLPADAPRRVRGARVEWLTLEAAFDATIPPSTCRRPGWRSHRTRISRRSSGPGTRSSWTRPARRRATPATCSRLGRSPLEERLLHALLRQPGVWVPRRDLLLALWPEEFSSRTREPKDPIALDRRLRQLKSALSAVFAELPAVSGAARDPIENLRTRGDLDGGYRLAVEPTRVRVVVLAIQGVTGRARLVSELGDELGRVDPVGVFRTSAWSFLVAELEV